MSQSERNSGDLHNKDNQEFNEKNYNIQIEEMTGVVAEQTPELVSETAKMSEEVVNQIKDNPQFKQEAINNLTGLLNGLKDEELRELLREAGVQNIDKVIAGIKEGNLAEDEGVNILNSLNEGLKNKTWKEKLFDTARGIASALSGLLTIKANVNGDTSKLPGHKNGLDYVPHDDYVARLHKGERVLTKEEKKEDPAVCGGDFPAADPGNRAVGCKQDTEDSVC